MARWTTVMDFVAMRSASRQPRTRGSWLYGAGPFALMVATVLLVVRLDVPFGWQILITIVVGVVVCPALVLLATVVFDQNPK